ncbi:MAG: 2-phosphosulfolactate phosphatase [Bacteroidales bacterium]|nr:2-phosphosulfolactate phosphatase [Bacteroidales bacterium]
MDRKNKIEVCFTPATYDVFRNDEAIVVVVDILRATTAICSAFMNGAERIIPVGTLEEAKAYKELGFLVAAERDGIVKDFADFGNSPFNFTKERVEGKPIVYSTTNGTNTIMMAKDSYKVLIGAYLNISTISKYILSEQRDVLIFCAGWKNKFNLEDSLFAGALAQQVLEDSNFYTICDSALASIDLWKMAKPNLIGYIEKAAQRHRLKKNKLDDVLEFCHTQNLTNIIPVLEGNYLVPLKFN